MRYQLASTPMSLRPKAATVLGVLGAHPLFFAKQGNRHPLGVYNLTFRDIVRHMAHVLDELDKAANETTYANPANYDWNRDLLNATDHLLNAIVQHLDSFATIVEAFFESKGNEVAERIKKSIKCEVRPYRDHVAKIVNAIKHRHAKLASFYFHDVGLFVPGYFVEGVCEGGAIGPDPTVHGDSNSAISFNRDLPFHMVNLYFASGILGGAIQGLLRSTPRNTDIELSNTDRELGEVMRRLSTMSRMYFPDEMSMAMPLVEYRGAIGKRDFSILLEYPAQRIRARAIPAGCRAQVSWSGDGASRTFKVPYWASAEGTRSSGTRRSKGKRSLPGRGGSAPRS